MIITIILKLFMKTVIFIRRNKFMIDKSDFCIFYFDDNYIPKTKTRSGTGIAYEYAIKKGKEIVNVFRSKPTK